MLSRLSSTAGQVAGWSLADVQLADVQLIGLATGLTALAGSLGVFDNGAANVTAYVTEQREQVCQRVARFKELLPSVMGALHAAAVPAVAVKGAALLQGVWGAADTRPMADIDVIVPVALRAQAAAALTRAGLRPLHSTAYEDVFLAWGDGGVGRTDGESVNHNGRVELHPGWVEFLHGYTVRGCAFDAAAFDHEALTVHVLGHLASTVVRAEVRAVNVVDVWWCAQRPLNRDRMAALMAATDPRLTAPALWLVHHLLPDAIPVSDTSREMARLPRSARRSLAAASPADVLRDPSQRTSFRWRQTFTMATRERVAVVDQMLWPYGVRSVRRAAQQLTSRR